MIITQRKINNDFDSKPSINHEYNFEISKSYIKNKLVLDVGCWSGQYAQLAIKLAKGVYGIDPNPEAIGLGKKLIPQVKFKIGSVLKIPYLSNQFDVVLFSEVIEHIPQGAEKRALNEIKRVLKPNGMLILSTPNAHPLSIILDPAYFLIRHRHYQQRMMEKLVVSRGFTIKKSFLVRGLTHLISYNLESLFKILTKKKPIFPKWVHRLLYKELHQPGFASLYIIAQKS